MPTIAVVGQRPSAGKTVLAVELAFCAGNALILDLDPAASAKSWSERRQSEWPRVVAAPADNVGQLVRAAEAAGYTWIFVDTSSHAEIDVIWQVMEAVDYTLIPSRPGMVELSAVGGLARFLRGQDARMAIVLNACMPASGRLADALLGQAFIEAKRHGLPVSPRVRTQRNLVAEAFTTGRVVAEVDPRSKAASEVGDLWNWVNRELMSGVPNTAPHLAATDLRGNEIVPAAAS